MLQPAEAVKVYIGTSKVTSKGQVTIPLPIRKSKGMGTGTDVVFVAVKEGVLVKKANDFEGMFSSIDKAVKEKGITREEIWEESEKQKLITLQKMKESEARQRRKDAGST